MLQTVMSPRAFVLLLGLLLASSLDAQPLPLELTIHTDKPTYDLGEPISLAVTLKNVSSVVQTVSAFDVGNIAVAELTKDGKAVPPLRTSISYEQDPFVLQRGRLTSLRPGQQVAIPYDVDLAEGRFYEVSTPLLSTTAHHQLLVYRLVGAGSYALRLQYGYSGPDAGFANVFRGTISSNPAVFHVR